jgi:hypothetical protein
VDVGTPQMTNGRFSGECGLSVEFSVMLSVHTQEAELYQKNKCLN